MRELAIQTLLRLTLWKRQTSFTEFVKTAVVHEGHPAHTCIVSGDSTLGAVCRALVQRVLEGSVLIDWCDVAVGGAGFLA